MSSSKALSFLDLHTLGVSVHWPEAVAVVLELAERAALGELVNVPALSEITIDSDGAIQTAAVARSSDPPVKALAGLLQALLGGPSPVPELEKLIAANVAKPPALESVGDFQTALAFFERPGRQALLSELARRAAEAVTAAEMKRELERIQAQQRDAEQPAKKILPKASKRRGVAPLIWTAAVVLVAAGGTGMWLHWTTHASASTTSPANRQPGLIERTASRIAGAVKSLVSLESDQPPTPEPLEESAGAKPPARRRAPAGKREAVALNAAKQPAPSAAPSPALSPALPPAGAAATSGESPAARRPIPVRVELDVPDPHAVFDAASAEVAPPIIDRPQLPSGAVEADDPDTGVLELLVSQDGSVDKVKLMSPSNRFEDRMIVAAAKAWRFTPAEKDGRPVRYRLRVPLTW